MSNNGYVAVTRGVRVSVEPRYLDDESDPEQNRFAWSYTIDIANDGPVTVQLLTRRWTITDARGRSEIVRGPGVVGQTPTLKPGEAFRYTSGCPLTTSSGFMVGSYGMVTADGEPFDVAIPAFSLDSPGERNRMN
jgi:ApaG protein